MNYTAVVVIAAMALTMAAPLHAQVTENAFSGPRIGATAGFMDENPLGTDLFTYGGEAGYDLAIGRNAVVGLTAELQDTKDSGRDLSLVARAGASIGREVLLYGLAGYSNFKVGDEKLDGFRVGAGAEFVFGQGYVKLEQRYSNYGDLGEEEGSLDVWQTVLGAGMRF